RLINDWKKRAISCSRRSTWSEPTALPPKMRSARRTISSRAAIARWNGLQTAGLPSFRSMNRKRSGSASRRARASDRLMALGPSPCPFLRLTPDCRDIHFGRGIDLYADKFRDCGDGCSWLGKDVFVVENQWREFQVRDH